MICPRRDFLGEVTLEQKVKEGRRSLKDQISTALDREHSRVGRAVTYFLSGIIILSVLLIGVETLPDLPALDHKILAIAEWLIVAIFSIEYVLRIAVAKKPWAYIRSWWGVIDLAAILPFYLGLAFTGFGVNLLALRSFRLLRLFRLLKLARYTTAMDRLAAAIRAVREELIVFGIISFLVLYLCSIGIYYFEHDAQPEAFASVFHSMWWAAVTLTTVGYGDVYPITVGGRIFTILVVFIGLGIIAIPTGLVASALMKTKHKSEDER
jgi:voltage-gated potassium channel